MQLNNKKPLSLTNHHLSSRSLECPDLPELLEEQIKCSSWKHCVSIRTHSLCMENCNHYMWKASRKDGSRSIRPFHQHPNTEPWATVILTLSVKSKYTQWEGQCEAALSGPRSATHTWDFRQVLHPPWKASSPLTVTTCPGNTTFLSGSPQQLTKHFHRFWF